METLLFTLVVAARMLVPYFQAHPMKVLTDLPLEKILQKPNTSGRLTKWAIKLSEFDIEYHPHAAIKAQVLADFVTEFTNFLKETPVAPLEKPCQVYVDGSFCRAGGDVGVHIVMK